jgi:ferredoxin-NADP reductase
MAGTALPGRLSWLAATAVEHHTETARAKSIAFEVPGWVGHRAGQHVDVRLTAPDGYQAQRSYSIASAPGEPLLMLTVERIEDGEVSPYLVDELREGDAIELRGPIGGYFVWQDAHPGPVLLLAGGSGIVPLRSMLRHRAASHATTPVTLLYSVRSPAELIYREELAALADVDVHVVYTREWPEDWEGRRGRIDAALLRALAWAPSAEPISFVCGPNGFVETAANALVANGHSPLRVRTERFGPSG